MIVKMEGKLIIFVTLFLYTKSIFYRWYANHVLHVLYKHITYVCPYRGFTHVSLFPVYEGSLDEKHILSVFEISTGLMFRSR